MNPVTAPMPAAPPSPGAQPSMPAPASSVVASIPVHTQQVPQAATGEDDELDKIMHDVGREMSSQENKPGKKGVLGFMHKVPSKPAHMQPVRPALSPLAQASPAVQAPAVTQQAPAAQQVQQAMPAPAAAKPKSTKSFPVFILFVTIVVTGFLVVAAYAAYNQ
jgi:hypothetical protein